MCTFECLYLPGITGFSGSYFSRKVPSMIYRCHLKLDFYPYSSSLYSLLKPGCLGKLTYRPIFKARFLPEKKDFLGIFFARTQVKGLNFDILVKFSENYWKIVEIQRVFHEQNFFEIDHFELYFSPRKINGKIF